MVFTITQQTIKNVSLRGYLFELYIANKNHLVS